VGVELCEVGPYHGREGGSRAQASAAQAGQDNSAARLAAAHHQLYRSNAALGRRNAPGPERADHKRDYGPREHQRYSGRSHRGHRDCLVDERGDDEHERDDGDYIGGGRENL